MVGLLVFPICLLLYYYGGEFIQLWMKDSFHPEMYEVLSILLVGYVFFLVQRGTTFPVLMGVSKMKWPTIVMFVAAIFNLGSSIWFGKIYGVYGVAWATSVPTICVALFLLAYISSILSIPILKCLINSTLIPGVSLLPIIILFYCFDSFDLQYSYLALILKIGVSMILTFLFDLFLVDKIYRGKFMNIISKVKGAAI
jgi:O-antigen/teichoic acid export membrane protein